MDFSSTQRMPAYDKAKRTREGQQTWVDGKVADFNARPARRITDVRIQGWRIVEEAATA